MQTIEEKQVYLRTEILDKGYDPETFSRFLSQMINVEDLDLEDLTTEQLKNAVEQFQIQFPKNNAAPTSSEIPTASQIQEENSPQEDDKPQEEEKSEGEMKTQEGEIPPVAGEKPPEESENKIEESKTGEGENNIENSKPPEGEKKPQEEEKANNSAKKEDANANNAEKDVNYIPPNTENPWKIDLNKSAFSDYAEIVKCIEEKPKQFTDKEDLYITVSSPEAVKKGFFSKKYFQYKLQIKDSLEPPVTRKLDDFDFLNKYLMDNYPGTLIPPVAPSHLSLKEDSVKKINYLTRFMNAVAENKIFRSSEFFTDFLTMEQEEFNQKRKNTYEKAPKPKNMNGFINMKGNIHLYITDKKDERARNLNKEIYKINGIYKRIDSLLDLIMKQYEEVSKTLADISKCFGELAKEYEGEKPLMKGMNWFNDFFNKWSEGYKEQKDFFMTDVKYYFKYVSKELDLVLPMYNTFKNARDLYDDNFKTYTKILQKTEKDEQKVVSSKRTFAYYLKQLLEEYDELKIRHIRRLAKEFVILSENRNKFINDYNTFNELLNFSIGKE